MNNYKVKSLSIYGSFSKLINRIDSDIDMYVIFKVYTPKKLTREQKKLFEELSSTDLKTSEFKKIEDYLNKNK